jgi:hypothetical protein
MELTIPALIPTLPTAKKPRNVLSLRRLPNIDESKPLEVEQKKPTVEQRYSIMAMLFHLSSFESEFVHVNTVREERRYRMLSRITQLLLFEQNMLRARTAREKYGMRTLQEGRTRPTGWVAP